MTRETIDVQKGPDDVWRTKKENAAIEADSLVVSEIPDFESMATSEQVAALISLMKNLNEQDRTNETDENYYIIEELAARTTALEAVEKYQAVMDSDPKLGRYINETV
jgi:hypothetical protein